MSRFRARSGLAARPGLAPRGAGMQKGQDIEPPGWSWAAGGGRKDLLYWEAGCSLLDAHCLVQANIGLGSYTASQHFSS